MLAYYNSTQNLPTPSEQDFANLDLSDLPLLEYDDDFSTIPRTFASDPDVRYMSLQSQRLHNPPIRIQSSSPLAAGGNRAQQSMLSQQSPFGRSNWGNTENLLSPSATYTTQNVQRLQQQQQQQSRPTSGTAHARSPSASSVASGGPPSPQDLATAYPYIVGSEAAFSPSSFDSFNTLDTFATTRSPMPKSLPTPVDTPVQSHFNSSDYQTSSNPPCDGQNQGSMRRIRQKRSPNHDDDSAAYGYSGAHSASTVSHHNSPATPQTAFGDEYEDAAKSLQNHGFNAQVNMAQNMPTVNFGANLYNNQLQNIATTQQQQQQLMAQAGNLSPYRSLADRIQAAQLDHTISRGASPASGVQRENSPYRQPSAYDQSQMATVAAAQRMRPTNMNPSSYQPRQLVNNGVAMYGQQQQQQSQARMPKPARQAVQPEQTTTVSPKEVELEYHGSEETLFPSSQQSNFSLPREESSYSTTSAFGQPAQFYTPVTSAQQSQPQYGYMPQPGRQQSTMRSEHSLPDFPAHLASMETTISSESGQDMQPPLSSQRSVSLVRPQDTSADSGSYACAQPGCSARFGDPARLTKHRRDMHQSTPVAIDTSPSTPTSSLLGGEGHVSSAAAIAARNAQSGPHRCERTNPTTGKACHSVFSRPYDLTRHEDTIHSGRKLKVRCHLCTEEKTFSRNDALTRHMRVVHPEVDWPGKTRKKGSRD